MERRCLRIGDKGGFSKKITEKMVWEFAELTGLDYEVAQVVYAAYATEQEEYGQILGNLDSYEVPLIDMFLFVCEQVDSGIVIWV